MSRLSHWNSQFCLLDLFEFCIYFQNDFVHHTFYNDVQMLGTNSYLSSVTMSFHMQNTFYCCLFLFYSIYLCCICCYIYQVGFCKQFSINAVCLFNSSIVLAAATNFLNLSNLVKPFFKDGLNDNEKLHDILFHDQHKQNYIVVLFVSVW